MTEWPRPCVSTPLFADQFPAALKKARVTELTGQVLRETREPGIYVVQWDHLRAPQKLHRDFFALQEANENAE